MTDNQKVNVNTNQCKRIGEILKKFSFRPEFYKRPFLTFESDGETKMRAYLFATAICHQTHTLGSKTRKLKGWDFLEYVYSKLATDKSKLLDPAYLAVQSIKNLSQEMKPLFSDDKRGDQCTLDRMGERCRFLIDIATILNKKYDGQVANLVSESNERLIHNGEGIYERLAEFEAYLDPLKKKSTLFVKLLMDAGFLKVSDSDQFVPIMDYHMQRVLLRMGCVEVCDAALRKHLLRRKPVRSDKPVRNACISAMKLIAECSGHEIIHMNDFFWPLGRSCCKEKLLCVDGECDKEPCTFNVCVGLHRHETCAFSGICKASEDPEYRKFWQPVVETHYY